MAVPFGFSFGDFVSGLHLLKNIIGAIQETNGARADYRALFTEIDSLQAALTTIEKLEISSLSARDYQAIDGAVLECRRCLDGFLRRISKYKALLHDGARASGFKPRLRQIQWALSEKENVARFRTQLERHSSAINMLLLTCQINQVNEQSINQNVCQQTLQAIHATTFDNALNSTAFEHQHLLGQLLRSHQELTDDIRQLSQNLSLETNLPPQVKLQKPVILLDACGKLAPFHLDFITSEEAFLAVLKVCFKQAGVRASGLEKLERSEYVVRDGRGIVDWTQPWEKRFRPGWRYDMRMTFRRSYPLSRCPSCLTENQGTFEDDIRCNGCGRQYQRVWEIPEPTHPSSPPPSYSDSIDAAGSSTLLSRSVPGGPPSTHFSPTDFGVGTRDGEDDEEEDSIPDFRRLHIVTPRRPHPSTPTSGARSARAMAKSPFSRPEAEKPRMLLSTAKAATYLSMGMVFGSHPKDAMAYATVMCGGPCQDGVQRASSVLIFSGALGR